MVTSIQFEAWAELINNTKRDYKIKYTELFGGDVHLQQSTFSFPFVKLYIKLEKYITLENYFQEKTQKRKLQRNYRIESDRFLSEGVVTVRDYGKVVGKHFYLIFHKVKNKI